MLVAGVLVVARLAQAEDSALPGTFSDPAHALELDPAIALVPADGVPEGFAIRDADPSRVKLYVDGFEVPALLAHGRALWFGGISHVRTSEDGMDLAYGGATGGMIEVDTDPFRGTQRSALLTPLDAGIVLTQPARYSPYGSNDVIAGRIEWAHLTARPGLDVESGFAGVVQERLDWRLSRHWSLTGSGFALIGDGSFGRLTATARYVDGGTRATVALSGLWSVERASGDARAEVSHEWRDSGGLSVFEVRGGANGSLVETAGSASAATGSVVGADGFEGGAFGMVVGEIAKRAVFGGGVRAEIFDRQVALSPRGALGLLFGDDAIAVSAMAYRQAQGDATPERATQVELKLTHHVRAGRIEATAYYIDRSRILVDDRATGVGTAAGVELREYLTQGAWTYYFAGALGHATRADRLTAPDHPADQDMPVRLDVLASWVRGDWRLGARVQVRSGLPYTPVTGAIYDGDTDTFAPIYGKVNSERAPWRRELDLRVDRRLLPKLRAYLDVKIDGGVLGYTYSYDESERLAVRAPIVMPWLGIVGEL